jgi:26S proteasome regulatory subunit N5
MLIKRRGQAK